jgi:DNA-binding transcriptional regulator PaaX
MGKGPCAEAGTKLANFSGIGERQLRRNLVELEKAGWISAQQIGPDKIDQSELRLTVRVRCRSYMIGERSTSNKLHKLVII